MAPLPVARSGITAEVCGICVHLAGGGLTRVAGYPKIAARLSFVGSRCIARTRLASRDLVPDRCPGLRRTGIERPAILISVLAHKTILSEDFMAGAESERTRYGVSDGPKSGVSQTDVLDGFLVSILDGVQGEMLVDLQALLALVPGDQLDLRVGEAL